jgi:Secretion system C-terminal sorting domain/SprB repeat
VIDPICYDSNDGGIFVDAINGVPPYSYTWSTGETGPINMDLAGGTYSVTVKDAIGCESSIEGIELIEPAPLEVDKMTSSSSCFENADGTVYLDAEGGTFPYYYAWWDGIMTPSRTDLPIGTYSFQVMDNNGCITMDEVTVAGPNELIATPVVVNNIICKASINVVPDGGTAPYDFIWEGGETTASLDNLCPGDYQVKITDAMGCETTETLSISALVVSETIQIQVAINPYVEEGNIKIMVPYLKSTDVRIYAANGQIIESFLEINPTDLKEIQVNLDLSNYSDGVYFIVVENSGLSQSEKIMISKDL